MVQLTELLEAGADACKNAEWVWSPELFHQVGAGV
jgi:hypothetical protein